MSCSFCLLFFHFIFFFFVLHTSVGENNIPTITQNQINDDMLLDVHYAGHTAHSTHTLTQTNESGRACFEWEKQISVVCIECFLFFLFFFKIQQLWLPIADYFSFHLFINPIWIELQRDDRKLFDDIYIYKRNRNDMFARNESDIVRIDEFNNI